MVITQPPGYKLYTHLFHSAMRKLNHKIIKFQLLRRFINDFKNMVKFDKYDYSKLDYEFYFGKRQITNNEIKLNNYLTENLKFNPYLDKLQNILNKNIDYSKKYNIELKSTGRLWLNISTNQYLTQDFIIKNINHNWNWYYLLNNNIIDLKFSEKYIPNFWEKNIIFKLETIKKHINKPWWDFDFININPYITLEFIETNINKSWKWDILSRNKNITLEFIEKYIDKPWDFSHLSIFVEEQLKTKKEFLEYYNNIDYSVHKYTEKQIEKNYDIYKETHKYTEKPIEYMKLEYMKLIIPKAFVVKYFNKNWNLEWLLSDSVWCPGERGGQLWTDITEDMLDKYPEKLCNYAYYLMIQRYGFSEEFMEKYIPKPWNWKGMLLNSKLPKKIRIKYMDEFLKVTSNNIRETNYKPYAPERFWYDFTEEELELFIDKIENWSGLYKYNKNITENFIIKYIEKPWGNQIFMNEKMCDAYMEKHKINITNVEFITADFNTRIGLQFYRFMPLSYCIKFINNYEITQSDDYRGTKRRRAWSQLSHNNNITKDFVKKYETKLPKLFIDGYLRGGRLIEHDWLTDEKNIPYFKPEQITRSPWLNK